MEEDIEMTLPVHVFAQAKGYKEVTYILKMARRFYYKHT